MATRLAKTRQGIHLQAASGASVAWGPDFGVDQSVVQAELLPVAEALAYEGPTDQGAVALDVVSLAFTGPTDQGAITFDEVLAYTGPTAANALQVAAEALAYEGPSQPSSFTTLEWTAPSPPPHGNFAQLPVVYRGPYEYSVPGQKKDFWPQSMKENN